MANNENQPLFNAGAAVYDSFRFLHAPAERTAELAELTPGMHVLDIACGSGRATITAADMVGESGSVTGIDIADKLLEVAEVNTAQAGLKNVVYRVGNAHETGFADDVFDAVLCASSVFLFNNVPAVLREMHRVVKSGGRLVFSVFGDTVFQPVVTMINNCLVAYEDIRFPDPVTTVTDSPQKCMDFLLSAGIVNADITTEHLPFTVETVEEAWRQVANSLLVRPRLAKLDKERYRDVKQSVQDELASKSASQGIVIDVPVIFCKSVKS